MTEHILAINPGATSTKVGLFTDQVKVAGFTIDYDPADFASCRNVFEQFERRSRDIAEKLCELHPEYRFDAVVGRGGLIGWVRPGAYLVDDDLVDVVEHRPLLDHASNLGGPLARELAQRLGVEGCPALIYDPVTVDSMMDCARITGVKGLQRSSMGHHLNMRAVAHHYANQVARPYEEVNVVVVHLGGGATASAHRRGEIVDFVSDDEIMFSAERSGGVPLKEFTRLVDTMDAEQLTRMLRKEAGLVSLAGTTDLRVLQERIDAGDREADTIMDALALQVGKAMATLAVSMDGEVDALVLTGGMAHSAELCRRIERRAGWIAPLHVFPGEEELEALAAGAHRVLIGKEPAHRLGE